MANLTKAATLLATILTVFNSCPEKHVFFVENDGQVKCLPCPEDCSGCYLHVSGKVNCGFCSEGAFLTDDKRCSKCARNCKDCTGPELKQCKVLREGYFLNAAANAIEECPVSGCQKCSDKGECFACKDGYFGVASAESPGNSTSPTTVFEECRLCEMPDCLSCGEKKSQIKGGTFNSCSQCKKGFTLVSGSCLKCPDYCESCQDETKVCLYCENGFYVDKSSNSCLLSSVPNCLIPLPTGVCNVCEAHYFLNEDKKCDLCAAKLPKCSFCAIRSLADDEQD